LGETRLAIPKSRSLTRSPSSVAAPHHHDVVGLDVAVHHAALVRHRQRPAHLDDDARRAPLGQALRLVQDGGEAPAVEELHHQEVDPALVASAEHPHRALVVDPPRRGRLAVEAVHQLLVLREAGLEDLDRHLVQRRLVEAAVHDAHGPLAEDVRDHELVLELAADEVLRGVHGGIHHSKLRAGLLGGNLRRSAVRRAPDLGTCPCPCPAQRPDT
jgi:hypothetical protein